MAGPLDNGGLAARFIAITALAQLTLLLIAWPITTLANPLTQAERHIAERLAQQQPWPDSPAHEHSGNNNSPHALAQQTLSVEPNVGKRNDHEDQIRIYQFNYQTEMARMLVVSLNTETVVRESVIDSVHLPLNERESQAALSTLAQSVEAVALLRADQQRRGLKPFSDLSELSVKASIFAPIEPEHICTKNRCALLSLFDHNNTVFAMEPFINLQEASIGWLNR